MKESQKKTIYTVVVYPKKISADSASYEFMTRSLQTSNMDRVKKYWVTQKEKYGNTHYVHIVSRENAKKMEYLWAEKIKQLQNEMFARLEKECDKIYAKYALYLPIEY